MPVPTPVPVPMSMEPALARTMPDRSIVRSPAALPIPPPDRPPSRDATVNYLPYLPAHSHSGHGRNFSVPNVKVYDSPLISSLSDNPEIYGNGAPALPNHLFRPHQLRLRIFILHFVQSHFGLHASMSTSWSSCVIALAVSASRSA